MKFVCGALRSVHRARRGVAAEVFAGGMPVVVRTSFKTMQDVELAPGMTGSVEEVDSEGDICVHFDALEELQWIDLEDALEHLEARPCRRDEAEATTGRENCTGTARIDGASAHATFSIHVC